MKLYITTLAVIISSVSVATAETVVVEPEVTKTIIEVTKPELFTIESIISKKALKSFETPYHQAPSHKAFTQSESGAWSWKSNRTSKEHAIKSALISCQINNKKSESL